MPDTPATPNDSIAYALAASDMLLRRFLDDLSPEEYLHRPVPKANCAAWLVGHLTLTERRALARLGETDLPPLPDGFERRFARDETAPGAAEFGDVTLLLALWGAHRRRLIEAVRRAPPERLAQPVEPRHPMYATVGELIHFLALHATMHAGQITIIRRSLGRPPMV